MIFQQDHYATWNTIGGRGRIDQLYDTELGTVHLLSRALKGDPHLFISRYLQNHFVCKKREAAFDLEKEYIKRI
jgi:hypothetical protein